MLETHLTTIFTTLAAHDVKFLVAGGLAVAAHGHARFTADLDLVVGLDPENAGRAITALTSLDYKPVAPVSANLFADGVTRSKWAREKGMVVFQLVCAERPETCVDLFTTEPFEFNREYERAPRLELLNGLLVPVVSYETLLAMKSAAGRPRDLDDIEQLKRARGEENLPNLS
jgi:hypothetical protein